MHKYKREKFHILMECYSLVWLITERKLALVQCMFVLTLWLPEVINVKLLPFMLMHYPANSEENTQTY